MFDNKEANEKFGIILKGCEGIGTQDEVTKYFNALFEGGFDSTPKAMEFDFVGFLISVAPDFNSDTVRLAVIIRSYLEACKERQIVLKYENVGMHPVMLAQTCEHEVIKKEVYKGFGIEEDTETAALSKIFQESDITKEYNWQEWLSILKAQKVVEITKAQLGQFIECISTQDIILIMDNCPTIRLKALNYLSAKFKGLDIMVGENRSKLFELWKQDIWARISYAQEFKLLQLIETGEVSQAAEIKLIVKHCSWIKKEILTRVVLERNLVDVIDGEIYRYIVYGSMQERLKQYKGEKNQAFLAIEKLEEEDFKQTVDLKKLPCNHLFLQAKFEELEKEGESLYQCLSQMAVRKIDGYKIDGYYINSLIDYMLERDESAFEGIDFILAVCCRDTNYNKLLNALLIKKAITLSAEMQMALYLYNKPLYFHYYKWNKTSYMGVSLIQTANIVLAAYIIWGIGENVTLVHLKYSFCAYFIATMLLTIRSRVFGLEEKDSMHLDLQLMIQVITLVPVYVIAGFIYDSEHCLELAYMALGDVLALEWLHCRMGCYQSDPSGIPIFCGIRAFFFASGVGASYLLKPSISFVMPEMNDPLICGFATLLPFLSSFAFTGFIKSGVSHTQTIASNLIKGVKFMDNVVGMPIVGDYKICHIIGYSLALVGSTVICLSNASNPIIGSLQVVSVLGLCCRKWCEHEGLEGEYQRGY